MGKIKITPSRIAGAIDRRISRVKRIIIDHARPSFSSSSGIRPLHKLPVVPASVLLDANKEILPLLARHFMRHEFDILGSGWVCNQYDMTPSGFDGFLYKSDPPVRFDKEGSWIKNQVNSANVEESKRIWQLIGRDDYRPIDWQRDIKSGYRWSAKQHCHTIPISPAPGVDIKVPWELGRLQHLPLMAQAALQSGPEQAHIFVNEIVCQLLDFIALNPPRFGINWRCPMDVGIRVSNIVLALDLINEMPADIGASIQDVFIRSIHDHADYIAKNLEWSEEARSNHYLANIMGLLFAAAVLPRSGICDAWLAFAVQELGIEIARQFRPDGGNFEASTGYHALSAEMAITGITLVQNLSETKIEALRDYDDRAIGIRPPFHPGPMAIYRRPDGATSYFSEAVYDRIKNMSAFITDTTKPDSRMVQIGDMDSGRLFKTQSTWRSGSNDSLIENILDRRDVAASGFLLVSLSPSRKTPVFGSLRDLIASVTSHPAQQQREWKIPIPNHVAGSLSLVSYPLFGLYIFRSNDFFLSVRCFDGRLDGEWGHSHDDNLALELQVSGRDLITDPGSFVYSPSPRKRCLYSSDISHFVPRVKNRRASATGSGLFSRRHQAHAHCLYMGPDGFVGRLQGGDWAVTRFIVFERGMLRILDFSEPFDLEPTDLSSATHKATEGYGKETTRPICSI